MQLLSVPMHPRQPIWMMSKTSSIMTYTFCPDKLILLGDLARVGTDHQTWEGVIGPEGVGKCNSNGLLLLRKCAEHNLLITNTVFRLPNRNNTSLMHPGSKLWYLIERYK